MDKKDKKTGDPIDRAKQGTDVSLDMIRDMLRAAVQEREGEDTYINEVYPAYVIYKKGDHCCKVVYSILDGTVQLGQEAVEVRRAEAEARAQRKEGEDSVEMFICLGQANCQ